MTLLAAHMTSINIEGLNSLAAFTQLNGNSDITGMAKRMTARSAASERVILRAMQIKRLQALVHWVKDHTSAGSKPSRNSGAMIKAMEPKEAERKYGKIDVGTINPGKRRTYNGWNNWQIAIANRLIAT